MSSVLTKAGFENSESLKVFSSRYPDLPCRLDETLERIWICHKNIEDIPQYDVENFSEDYSFMQNTFETNLHSCVEELDTALILGSIYSHFGKKLTSYILTKCFVFYNWGINSYEPIFNRFLVQKRMEEYLKRNKTKLPKPQRNPNQSCDNSIKSISKMTSSSKHQSSKGISYQRFKKTFENTKPCSELRRNLTDPNQETFNLNKILYDLNEKPKWPSNHILSTCDADTLLSYIIQVPVILNIPVKGLLIECNGWTKLRKLLGDFVSNHRKIEKNYGYGRILKSHLNKVKFYSSKRLNCIPKSTINSYIIDVVRKTIPLGLFGSNRLRKKFFTQVIKVINGSKMESFMWFSLLRDFLQNKTEIPWCSDISNSLTQNLLLLKLIKFIILGYIFIILRNNFYVTETGSSSYGLRFYRKGDIERASFVCISKLIYYKHVRKYKKSDFDVFSTERKWVDCGFINEKDLCGEDKKFMAGDTEFKLPVAKIRFLPKNDCSEEIRIITYIPRRKTCSNVGNEALIKVFERRLNCRKEKLFIVKLLLEYLVEKLGTGINPVPSDLLLEKAWKKAAALKETFGNVHFVKADIADAFDSVRHDLLMEILEKAIKEHTFHLLEITEWRKIRGKMKKSTRLSFISRPRENSILVNRKKISNSKYKNIQYLEIIKQVVTQQRVEIKGRVYKLIRGLAQGSVGKFSPQLSEMYYSTMDKLYFKNLINSENSILLRGVDDYLLITSDVPKAKLFLQTIYSGIGRYNVKFHKDKLKSNLLENVKEIVYLGLIFNFENMSVKPNYTKTMNVVSRIRLTDSSQSFHFNKNKFLHRKSLQLNSLKLLRITVNNKYNSVETVRRIMYQACVLQSFRVMSFVKYLYRGGRKNEVIVFRVLVKSFTKIKNLVGCLPEEEARWLFFSALLKVFENSSGQFMNLLVMIKYKLGVCEKKFVNVGHGLMLELLKKDVSNPEFRMENKNVFGKFLKKQ